MPTYIKNAPDPPPFPVGKFVGPNSLFAEKLNAISRCPVSLVVITLDYCANFYGQEPCKPVGERICHNTFNTCRSRANFKRGSRQYRFTSNNAPLPFKTGERPYIDKIGYLPTEIKGNLPVNGRATVDLMDEPDTDAGIDPYLKQRSGPMQGTFFKKLLARNRNFQGRMLEIYDGFVGLAEEDFKLNFKGKIDNIKLGKGTVSIEAVDLLKSLTRVEVAARTNIHLRAEIDDQHISFGVSKVDDLDPNGGYLRIDDEIIRYSGVDTKRSFLTDCERGLFGTRDTKKEQGYDNKNTHKQGAKIQKCRYYKRQNAFDILLEMLTKDVPLGDFVDRRAFKDAKYLYDCQDNCQPFDMLQLEALITEPTKLGKLYFEIVDLLDCKSWVSEEGKITIKRNLPNFPSFRKDRPSIAALITDEANIISHSVDLNLDSRISRLSIYWDKKLLGKDDDAKDYARLDIAIDADAEGPNEYGDLAQKKEAEQYNDYDARAEKKIMTRWLRPGSEVTEEERRYAIQALASRPVILGRDPMPILTIELEIKDQNIHTGDHVIVHTNALQWVHGEPFYGTFQVIRRDRKGNRITLKCLLLSRRKVAFIAPAGYPSYEEATIEQREYGFICNDDGTMPDGSGGYILF
jgi:hypothetical protein